jgi:hypothetical protein
MKRNIAMKKSMISLLLAVSATSIGCTVNLGGYGTNSHFAYPNSNVTPMGQVKASSSKISFFISPSFADEEIITLTQDAIAQKPGADLLLNFSLDTKLTSFVFVTKADITIEGTAAKLEVGTQELKAFYDKVQYKAK